jgi:hypothetical protein
MNGTVDRSTPLAVNCPVLPAEEEWLPEEWLPDERTSDELLVSL